MILTKKRAGLWEFKKPQEAQKAKALWKMKAAKDAVCVFAHSIRGVECAWEVRTTWRALFLLDAERAGDDAG